MSILRAMRESQTTVVMADGDDNGWYEPLMTHYEQIQHSVRAYGILIYVDQVSRYTNGMYRRHDNGDDLGSCLLISRSWAVPMNTSSVTSENYKYPGMRMVLPSLYKEHPPSFIWRALMFAYEMVPPNVLLIFAVTLFLCCGSRR